MPAKTMLDNGVPIEISEILNLKDFDTTVIHNKFSFRKKFGSGAISINQFDQEFITLEVKITPNVDFEFNLEYINSDFLLFTFVIEGSVAFGFEKPSNNKILEQYSSVSVFTESNQLKSLKLKKSEQVIFHSVCISKKTFLKVCDDFSQVQIHNNDLKQILKGLESSHYRLNFGYNIIEELKKINLLDSSDANMRLLKMKSRYQLVLAIHLDELYKALYEDKTHTGLSSPELKTINRVAEFISENPGLNHLQASLCKEFFISQSKLQQGFKVIHNTTVSNFTRIIRLKKAEGLLRQSELNVSEIVYTVGFTSRSYFSKIFKRQYATSPTEYRARLINKNIPVV